VGRSLTVGKARPEGYRIILSRQPRRPRRPRRLADHSSMGTLKTADLIHALIDAQNLVDFDHSGRYMHSLLYNRQPLTNPTTLVGRVAVLEL
jgi:hypothetical protein